MKILRPMTQFDVMLFIVLMIVLLGFGTTLVVGVYAHIHPLMGLKVERNSVTGLYRVRTCSKEYGQFRTRQQVDSVIATIPSEWQEVK